MCVCYLTNPTSEVFGSKAALVLLVIANGGTIPCPKPKKLSCMFHNPKCES